ncbi:MAG: 3-deoxy-manno-octulosonate cytidylyltransferase [Bacteroidota bacterium]
MKFIGIIPARYASTRLPGKPLIDILGKPMIQWVYERSVQALDTVFVATDNKRILNVVHGFGGNAVMTSKKHKSGTDRCSEAVEIISEMLSEKFDIIINIQGDEPFVFPEQINAIKKCFKSSKTQIATLVKPINNSHDIFDSSKPKVVINKNKEAIYFSRSPIPYIREADKKEWIKYNFYKHIGLYAYRYDILKKITALKPGFLEKCESLEQLRWIENGYKIKVDFTEYESISIDTKKDLQKLKQASLL